MATLSRSYKKIWLGDGSGWYYVRRIKHPVYFVISQYSSDDWMGYMEIDGNTTDFCKTKKYKKPGDAATELEKRAEKWFMDLFIKV
jgi:hypothetical protein